MIRPFLFHTEKETQMSKAMANLTSRFPELVEQSIADAFKDRGFLTWNDGIEMWALDRPVASCTHCTSFCRRNCYTQKAYRQYHHAMPAADIKNEHRWGLLTGEGLAKEIAGKSNRSRARKTDRVRFCTKGEPFSELADIDKVRDIAVSSPGTLFWVPTRAWRREAFRAKIEEELFDIPNLRIMASIDPSNSREEVQAIDKAGWSKMFFRIDYVAEAEKTFGIKFSLCPKTHEGQHGSCQTCNLCFGDGQNNVHLKKH